LIFDNAMQECGALVESGEGIESSQNHSHALQYICPHVESGEGIESSAFLLPRCFEKSLVESGEGIESSQSHNTGSSTCRFLWNPVKELKVVDGLVCERA